MSGEDSNEGAGPATAEPVLTPHEKRMEEIAKETNVLLAANLAASRSNAAVFSGFEAARNEMRAVSDEIRAVGRSLIERFGAVEERVGAAERRMAGLEGGLGRIERSVEKLVDAVATNTRVMAGLQSAVASIYEKVFTPRPSTTLPDGNVADVLQFRGDHSPT